MLRFLLFDVSGECRCDACSAGSTRAQNRCRSCSCMLIAGSWEGNPPHQDLPPPRGRGWAAPRVGVPSVLRRSTKHNGWGGDEVGCSVSSRLPEAPAGPTLSLPPGLLVLSACTAISRSAAFCFGSCETVVRRARCKHERQSFTVRRQGRHDLWGSDSLKKIEISLGFVYFTSGLHRFDRQRVLEVP